MALAIFVLSVTRAAMYHLSLCEDFEGVETGRASDPHIWKLNMGDGRTIVVDDAQAVRGTKSARVQVTQDRQWAHIETSAILPEATNSFWEAGVWHCIEWLFDPGTDTSRFIWNGEERSAPNVAGTANTIAFDMPQLRALKVGFTVYQPIARDFTVWIDEIAVSNSRNG